MGEHRLTKDRALQADLERIARTDWIDWEKLRNKTIMVTGATGLVGSQLVLALLEAERERRLDLHVVAAVRNLEKAKAIYALCPKGKPELFRHDVMEPVDYPGEVHFIVHGASVTSSRDFVEHPVRTLHTAFEGTRHMLEFARSQPLQGMVYLSSMEAYGVVDEQHFIVREKDYGYIDPMQVRSSYSEGKRMAECQCNAYASEYSVPVRVARLAQTFGAGVPDGEGRVFAQFALSILRGTDIVMHTDGSKAHCYCYTADVVSGLLTILLRGEAGEAYNVSNEDTFSSIREMAEMLVARYPDSGSSLVIDIPENLAALGYAPTSRMKINADKLKTLGWQPQIDLGGMYERLMSSMKENWQEFQQNERA